MGNSSIDLNETRGPTVVDAASDPPPSGLLRYQWGIREAAFAETNQALARWMEDNLREGLTVYAFPRDLHKKIRTINNVENLNKQIRRRTRVVGIFPHEASALRLISAVMAEIHEEWLTGRRYLDLESEEKEDLVPQPV